MDTLSYSPFNLYPSVSDYPYLTIRTWLSVSDYPYPTIRIWLPVSDYPYLTIRIWLSVSDFLYLTTISIHQYPYIRIWLSVSFNPNQSYHMCNIQFKRNHSSSATPKMNVHLIQYCLNFRNILFFEVRSNTDGFESDPKSFRHTHVLPGPNARLCSSDETKKCETCSKHCAQIPFC